MDDALLTERLGRPVYLETAGSPLDEGDLLPNELAVYRTLTHPRRKRSWLLGRAALRRLLCRLCENPDTGLIAWPNPRISISHTDGLGVAVALAAGNGVGVDFEVKRPSEKVAKLYLTPDERSWLLAQSPNARADHRRHLWAVKEAVYKADVNNADSRMGLYQLIDPSAESGEVVYCHDPARRFLYTGGAWQDGYLAVAVRQ